MANIIDGKLVSSALRKQIKSEVGAFTENYKITPALAVILVGNNPASRVYVSNKHKACLEAGIRSIQIELPSDTTEEELLAKIEALNTDNGVHGILVQLPLPSHISEDRIINAISPDKDVDAFHPINVGRIVTGEYDFLPCTPSGIMSLFDYYGVEICGKNCVVIGRSNIVGKPMSLLLLERNGTVTVAHSKTKNLSAVAKEADILVVAVGKPKLITADYVKSGAVVVDVGINRLPDGSLVGDVDFESVSERRRLSHPFPAGLVL